MIEESRTPQLEPPVVIATASNEAVAHMWTEYLRNQSVRCFARSRGPGVGAFASAALFEHDIVVSQAQAQAAQELLAEYADGRDLALIPLSPEHPRSDAEPTILYRIVAELRAELPERRLRVPLRDLWARCQERNSTSSGRMYSLSAAVKGESLRLIAEVKRASPSRGLLRGDLDAVETARLYRDNGAAAISILTEERHFKGSLDDLSRIVAALDADAVGAQGLAPIPRPPVLRKDFIFDPYQIYEARAAGADAVLLIVAILSDGQLYEFIRLTEMLGMEALVEVHDESEVERALTAGKRVIGINNRDLRTFQVDLNTTERLRALIPSDCIVVSESGISSPRDAAQVRNWGVDAILVGEAIVTAPDMAAKVRELAAVPSPRGTRG